MKMFLLSDDEDTLTGLRLAGIKGALVESEQEFDRLCDEKQDDGETGILLITRSLAKRCGEKILNLKKSGKILVAEVPDVYSRGSGSESITRYIQESVGIKI